MDPTYVVAQAYLMGLRNAAQEQRRDRAAAPPRSSRRAGRGRRPRAAAGPSGGDVMCWRAAAGARA
ncbi:hypothetical protein [Motilibacter aurantiacus]|uniref:hypothetical protein n=1 Tax=Motilibacter aurantiacus TaxID=2714955 RepID=UPI00140C612E|nr:hypothetical protein [Motilibacter aurantiacus]NHC44582.1 hypothetical protein [Motilibacter aurantiacus]